MQRLFFTNLAFLLAVNLLVKPFWLLGVDRSVQNVVGPEAYGLYFALFNFSLLSQIILDFGIQFYNNRNIAQYNQLLEKYFPTFVITKTLLALGYLAFTFAVALIIGYRALSLEILIFLALNQVLISLVAFIRSNVSGLHRFKADSMLSVTDKLLMILIIGSLLWLEPFGRPITIQWFVYAQTISYGATALISLLVLNPRLALLRFRFQPARILYILKQSFPYALTVFLMSGFLRLDAVLIHQLLPVDGDYYAGIYAAGYRLLDAANMLGYMFATLLLPIFARQIKEQMPLQPLCGSTFRLIVSVSAALAAACFSYRNEIMGLLYRFSDPQAGDVLGLLMLSFVAMSTMYVFGTLISAGGNLSALNKLFAAALIMNVLLNLWWIPYWQATGAALAAAATQLVVVSGEIVIARRQFGRLLDRSDWLRITAFIALLILANWLIMALALPWSIRFGLALAAGAALSWITGLIRLGQLFGEFRKLG